MSNLEKETLGDAGLSDGEWKRRELNGERPAHGFEWRDLPTTELNQESFRRWLMKFGVEDSDEVDLLWETRPDDMIDHRETGFEGRLKSLIEDFRQFEAKLLKSNKSREDIFQAWRLQNQHQY